MSTPASVRRSASRYPASSKMLDVYLSDIASLLGKQRWEEAETAALALPNIAVSLSEEDGRSSLERYREWCRVWIAGQEREETYAQWYERTTGDGSSFTEGVPVSALRSLRLHRLMRTGDILIAPRMAAAFETQGVDVTHLCQRLIRAMNDWYARFALRNESVQQRLARLAVLR
jgi:hypothetical protein